jgi:ATP-dependent Clp protease ATP-binding subunit ClpB
MNPQNFTQKTAEAFQTAQALAAELQHSQVNGLHFLYALLTQEDTLINPLLESIGIKSNQLKNEVMKKLSSQPQVQGSTLNIAGEMQGVLTAAEKLQRSLKDEYLSVEHVFMGLLKAKTVLMRSWDKSIKRRSRAS